MYFIKNNRYKKIIEQFDKKKGVIFLNAMILIYPYLSFFFLFKILKIDSITTFITVGILVLIDAYFYLTKNILP